MKTYLVTGGAGFIGSNFVKYMLKKYNEIKIIIIDKLTYAGNLGTIQEELKDKRVAFIKGDICDRDMVSKIFEENIIDYVVNFAAESHVDRSIENPKLFLETNIIGTQTLMDVAKKSWATGKDDENYPIYRDGVKFLQVSTDEVYGSLEREYPNGRDLEFEDKEIQKVLRDREDIPKTFGKKFFTEETPLSPRSPYSTSKTAADMLVTAYAETYHLPVNVTRCSNNYGPYHFPEKLIPLIIKNIFEGKTLPVYGDGKQVRDWLYVEDHCKGIDMVISGGSLGEIYNIGGFNEKQNINIVKTIIDKINKLISEDGKTIKEEYKKIIDYKPEEINYDMIEYVKDRLGHDVRYAINPRKTVMELGFYPETTFEEGIEKTVKWYLNNQKWIKEVVSGDYKNYYEKLYDHR